MSVIFWLGLCEFLCLHWGPSTLLLLRTLYSFFFLFPFFLACLLDAFLVSFSPSWLFCLFPLYYYYNEEFTGVNFDDLNPPKTWISGRRSFMSSIAQTLRYIYIHTMCILYESEDYRQNNSLCYKHKKWKALFVSLRPSYVTIMRLGLLRRLFRKWWACHSKFSDK